MAQRVGASNSFLAGQFQHAAEMSFNKPGELFHPELRVAAMALCSFPVKNHFNPALAIGVQDPASSMDMHYNGTIMVSGVFFLPVSHEIDDHRATRPRRDRRYAFALPSGQSWSQAFMNAGGTAVQLALNGSTSVNNGQVWTAVGINRIGRVSWETRLGPEDGAWSSIGNGANFGPTWITRAADRLGRASPRIHRRVAATSRRPLPIPWSPSAR